MEILEAFDLVRSARAAAKLCGCSHNTVTSYVNKRDAGQLEQQSARPKIADQYLAKIEEWVDDSEGEIRADVVHNKLQPMDYPGSERTTRRAVAATKQAYRQGKLRVYRPWIPEPGKWFQWDWGTGPEIDGRSTCLFCAWLAWSRFRVVVPTWDRTLPTLFSCLDRTLRAFGGVPTYALTDNERTVTTEHIARIPVRHPKIVAAARHYGLTVASCVPFDPESKGGSEATVRIAKADLVPTRTNLLPSYRSFAELEHACESFGAKVNSRVHKVTRKVPAEMLAVERQHLHLVPDAPYVAAFGQTRRVSWSSIICFSGARYSVPNRLCGKTVRARVEGEELVIVHEATTGAAEVARHPVLAPGNASIKDSHYPNRPEGALDRTPVAGNPGERAFLELGDGARSWLIEAAGAGAPKMRNRMAEAVALAEIYGKDQVDRALGQAAAVGRFAAGDLESIIVHGEKDHGADAQPAEPYWLQPGTASWTQVGR